MSHDCNTDPELSARVSACLASIGFPPTPARYYAESDGGYCGSEADCPRTYYVCHTHGRERIDCASMKEARELAHKLNTQSVQNTQQLKT